MQKEKSTGSHDTNFSSAAVGAGDWKENLHWLSVFLRLAIGSLFFVVALSKVPNGIGGTIDYFKSVFEDTMLPLFIPAAYGAVIMFVEFAIAIWLFSGYRLALAWKCTAVVLLSLAIGMVFASEYATAANNYMYGLFAMIGLLASGFDRWTVGARNHG